MGNPHDVELKNIEVGTVIFFKNDDLRFSNGYPIRMAIVFEQELDTNKTLLVSYGRFDEQVLLEAVDTIIVNHPKENLSFYGKTVFVRDLKRNDCINITCDSRSGEYEDLSPVQCKVDDPSAFIHPKGQIDFNFTVKHGVNIKAMLATNSALCKTRRGFNALLNRWNYFEKAPVFFNENELRFHGTHGDDFGDAYDIIDSTLCRLDESQMRIVINQYVEDIDSEPYIEARKRHASRLLILIENLFLNESDNLLSIIKECVKKSSIGKDIYAYATQGKTE